MVPAHTREGIAVEIHADGGFPDHVIAVAQQVGVVPAIGVEAVFHKRSAENKAHLALAHAGLQLVDHVLGDDVPLLNVNTVDTGKPEIAAGGERDQCQCQENTAHGL